MSLPRKRESSKFVLTKISDFLDSRLRGNDKKKALVLNAPSFPRKRESMGGGAMTKQPAVYILASKRNGTLYVGVTSDLVKRVWEHKQNVVAGFTRTYHVHNLVYFEQHEDMRQAILREKQIKKWNRAWKIELIEKTNSTWQDLWPSIC